MKNKKLPKSAFLPIDDYEKDLMSYTERDDFVPKRSKDADKMIKIITEAAKNHVELRKTKPITIRVNQADLIMIKAKASKKNMPYQTLIGDILRRYAGR